MFYRISFKIKDVLSMIREIEGDLLTSGADILCHQTNYVGVMDAGIAYTIKTKLLTDDQYKVYQKYCQLYGSGALGTVQFIEFEDGRYVANVFSQDDFYSRDKNTITDYAAMEMALVKVRNTASEHGLTVAIPGYMGCGIAGGNWDCVKPIIKKIFKYSPVDCMIVYKERR